uniref:Uncharacterized protein n=1 Tax=Rhodosorus marinus TaxID=101924 RepID=A0A7S2Z8U3_9RHOD|mmetsp:Transcript_10376/g.43179  ORF Transcript_10376/g.43179 Transcript_10376/m.43179 type:complete len:327 (+) Transcript_10376:58-1038(+)
MGEEQACMIQEKMDEEILEKESNVYYNLRILLMTRSGSALSLTLSAVVLPVKSTMWEFRDALQRTPLVDPKYDAFLENWAKFSYLSKRDIYGKIRKLQDDVTLQRLLRDEMRMPGTVTFCLEQCRNPRYSKDREYQYSLNWIPDSNFSSSRFESSKEEKRSESEEPEKHELQPQNVSHEVDSENVSEKTTISKVTVTESETISTPTAAAKDCISSTVVLEDASQSGASSLAFSREGGHHAVSSVNQSVAPPRSVCYAPHANGAYVIDGCPTAAYSPQASATGPQSYYYPPVAASMVSPIGTSYYPTVQAQYGEERRHLPLRRTDDN